MSDAYPISEVPAGMSHQYIMAIRGGRVTHMWTLSDKRGAIHIHGWKSEGFASYGPEWIGGVEIHSPKPFEYSNDKPDQECCWLLAGPCWHDGTSLYFSERIAPMLERTDPEKPMPAHIHSYIISELKYWMRSRFDEAEDAPHTYHHVEEDKPDNSLLAS